MRTLLSIATTWLTLSVATGLTLGRMFARMEPVVWETEADREEEREAHQAVCAVVEAMADERVNLYGDADLQEWACELREAGISW